MIVLSCKIRKMLVWMFCCWRCVVAMIRDLLISSLTMLSSFQYVFIGSDFVFCNLPPSLVWYLYCRASIDPFVNHLETELLWSDNFSNRALYEGRCVVSLGCEKFHILIDSHRLSPVLWCFSNMPKIPFRIRLSSVHIVRWDFAFLMSQKNV